MTDKLSEELSDDSSENLDRFVIEAIESSCIWGLQGPDGWALCASEKYEGSDVMPLWSREDFARVHCVDDWHAYAPIAIELEEFLEDWLPGMHEDVLLVGVNWNLELEGEEMEPLDLLEEFEQELQP
jgi:hypothetical protein